MILSVYLIGVIKKNHTYFNTIVKTPPQLKEFRKITNQPFGQILTKYKNTQIQIVLSKIQL